MALAFPPSPRRTFPMTAKYRSFTITKGVPRSPNRSMLRAIGYQDADFGEIL